MRHTRTPQPWQTDSQNVQTERVQFWSNGSMTTCQMPLEQARLLVDSGNAFVISQTAIGLLYEGSMES
jgi:hypothetical protein